MAQFASIPCLSKIQPVNNALLSRLSDRGEVGAIDWSAQGGSQTRTELYNVELFYPKILKSDVTLLETFFDTNVLLPVTTQPLGDGREYVGYLVSEPIVDPINAIRFNLTIKMLCWKGMVPGAVAHFRETGIVGTTPVTQWTNDVSGGSAYDLDVVEGTAANMLTSTMNGLPCLLFDGTVNLSTTSGQNITDPIVFVVVQYDSTPTANTWLFDSLAGHNVSMSTRESSADKFSFYQGTTVLTLSEAFDNDAHVHVGEFNGDLTSKLTVSGVGSVTGDAGASAWTFATLGAQYDATLRISGKVSELCVYPSSAGLTDTEINQNLISLQRKWGTK